MQSSSEYNEEECPWYYYDSSYKTLLGACLISLDACQLYAFLNHFFGVFQMTALFTLVLERYLLARYTRRERTLVYRYYWSLGAVAWVNALVFAIPPLLGYGIYSCDATDTICTYLWPSSRASAKHLGYAVPYTVLCGIMPIIGIFYYMGKANRLESIYYRNERLREEKHLTKCVHALSVLTLALWTPAAVLAGCQWFPLLLYGYRPHVPQVLALIAPITSEAATCVPVLSYLSGDNRIRAALLGRMKRNYALLPQQYAIRYRRD
ncbi:unnamed protein product [Leptosia nina]|uniref:G-protein coupled receptors family 1 profile domain-containing protein n=1 Tax=Leptosia nina TaxID=320188 RepID=A0AAV1JL26_9NEOP